MYDIILKCGLIVDGSGAAAFRGDLAVKNGTIVPAGCGVGGIPELLTVINLAHQGEFILTLEPHLRVFAGLAQLEGGPRTALGNAYASSAEAFAAAVTNLRMCIPRNAQQA